MPRYLRYSYNFEEHLPSKKLKDLLLDIHTKLKSSNKVDYEDMKTRYLKIINIVLTVCKHKPYTHQTFYGKLLFLSLLNILPQRRYNLYRLPY